MTEEITDHEAPATPSMAMSPYEPRNFSELIEFSKYLADSSLVPAPYQKKPANIIVAVGLGKSLGLTAFQSVQDIMVVNGKPSLYGDLPKALLIQSGQLESFDEDAPHVALKQGYGRCVVKLKGMTSVERRFSVEEAKTAGLWLKSGPWTTNPGRMLQLRARGFAVRDAAPHILKGLHIAEEMMDMDSGGRGIPPMEPKAILEPAPAIEGPVSTPESISEEVVHDAEVVTEPTADENPVFIDGAQRSKLFQEATAVKISPAAFKAYLASRKIKSTGEITTAMFDEVIAWIQKQKS